MNSDSVAFISIAVVLCTLFICLASNCEQTLGKNCKVNELVEERRK